MPFARERALNRRIRHLLNADDDIHKRYPPSLGAPRDIQVMGSWHRALSGTLRQEYEYEYEGMQY
jgi:hypothetical protein